MKTEPQKGVLDFGTRRIPYRLHRSDRKRVRIVVAPALTVDVFAPARASDEQILESLRKKAAWIARTLDRVASYHPLPTPKNYVSGETFLYLGRQYRLKIVEGETGPAKLYGRYLWVPVNGAKHERSGKRSVDKWYRTRAREVFERYLAKCYAVASRHGVPEPTLAVRAMRRRWGSCSTSRRITLNLNLVKVPVHCIEYVIMHELCHLRHHDHSRAFYSLLTRCQPDWRRRKDIIDRFRLE